jgi:hypothetical protein
MNENDEHPQNQEFSMEGIGVGIVVDAHEEHPEKQEFQWK